MTGDVVNAVFEVVADTAPEIRTGLRGRRERVDEENPSDERQMAADVWADEVLAERITSIDGVGQFASEERKGVQDCGDGLSVAVDPLDGSSNLKSNNSMGTIVGIYDGQLPAKGRALVGAAYVLYGPVTTMMVARDETVTEYEITDEGRRTIEEGVDLPDDPVVYGFGGRIPDWTQGFTEFAREIENELKLRYGGAMIADVNQVMTYGGIFAYPGLESRPEGKLRLQFEGNPIAHIVEIGGGASSNGLRSLLDVEPTDLHQRVPVHVGNELLIERLEATLNKY
ncbi:MAG: fructose-1,6-bisphosphatase I [Halobacteriales archaeon]|jgi:fructose-1,6-bisphosphatase I